MDSSMLHVLTTMGQGFSAAKPAIAGAALNALLTKRALPTATIARLVTEMLLAVLVGLGCLYVAEAAYAYEHREPDKIVLRAILFLGSAGGASVLLWLVGKVDKLSALAEKKLLESLSLPKGGKDEK